MQSPTDSSNLSHISPAQRYEEAIEIYSGDDPLSIWESYINWMSNSDPAACFKLATRCINEFKKEKRYLNDWRFIRICIHRVRSCKDKVSACRRLHDLGIGKREGLFYKAWADFCESQGEIEEAKLVYDKGLDLSDRNIDLLKASHEQFVKQNCQRKTLPRVPEKEEYVPKDVRKVEIILGSKNIEDFKHRCLEEFMAEEWFAGKRRSQKLPQKPDFREMRINLHSCTGRKSTFGSALENIREEAESYHTMNSTLSPVKKLRSFRHESIHENDSTSMVSQHSVSSNMPLPVNSIRQTGGSVNTHLQQHGMDENGVSDDDYEDDMTKHSKYAKTYLEGLFFGTSEPDKSIHNFPERERNDKPFSIYVDSLPQSNEVRPFTIYEDSETTSNEEKIQRTPEVEGEGDVEINENAVAVGTEDLVMEQDDCKAALEQVTKTPVQENIEMVEDNNQQDDASFLSTSIINFHSQADKSIANFQEFSKGLKPGKTSTQNVTDVFKFLAKSTDVRNFLQTLDESVDRSKECFRQEPEDSGNPCISLCYDEINSKKNETPLSMEDVNNPCFTSKDLPCYQEVEKSVVNDSMKRHIEEYKLDETLTGKPNDMAVDDDDPFHDGPSLVHNSQPQSRVARANDCNEDLQPEKTSAQYVREMFKTEVGGSHGFIAAYEAPVSDQSDEEMKISKSNSRWRRCSVSSIVPPLVAKLSDSTIDEIDFNLSSGAESRLNQDNNREDEFARGTFATSFTDTSILIDTDNPYNEESIQSFIAHLNPPLSKYPGYQEIKQQRMPAFKIGSNINLGTKKFVVKKILGEGAYAKAYHLSHVDRGLENKKDCVVKLQRPSCPWEFYITRELRKRLEELIKEQFINVIPSVMHISEAYFFDDGSLFLNEMHNYGTLLDLINLQRCKMIELPQWFVLMLCYELVCLVDAMHRCSMIHGDLKPDNVLLRQLPLLKDEDSVVCLLKTKTSFLKLIDFGQSIDMAMYPRRTEFTSKSKKKDFQCTEMKMGKSWSYHIDLYFLAGLMYFLLMGNYMTPSLVSTNKWSAHVKLKRSWKHEERIREFVDMLINIESADKMPDLSIMSAWLLSAIDVKTDNYNEFIKQLASILNK